MTCLRSPFHAPRPAIFPVPRGRRREALAVCVGGSSRHREAAPEMLRSGSAARQGLALLSGAASRGGHFAGTFAEGGSPESRNGEVGARIAVTDACRSTRRVGIPPHHVRAA